ncbi:DUF2510 domain-containing protein [Rhodococcus zopfii]|uniref:DUF2510 domain-containing protein n=1 Tax=Rhodococcus zopfii TaxID=43772 RepID=UPI0009333123
MHTTRTDLSCSHPPDGPDPHDPLVERYRDGRQWTAHTQPKGAADPTRAFAPVDNSAPPNPGEPAKRRHR